MFICLCCVYKNSNDLDRSREVLGSSSTRPFKRSLTRALRDPSDSPKNKTFSFNLVFGYVKGKFLALTLTCLSGLWWKSFLGRQDQFWSSTIRGLWDLNFAEHAKVLISKNFNKTDNFESFQTKQKYKINHHLNCNDKFLTYLLFCKVCGLQYVGSTTAKFCLRRNNYEENDRKALRGEEHMQSKLFEHFATDNQNCFLTDCSIRLTDKTDGSDPTRRKNCSLCWWFFLHAFYTFFLGNGLFYVKCILLKSYLCIL